MNAYIGVMNAETGILEAMIDGEEVTTMRTAAASLCAAETFLQLQKKETDSVCNISIVGSGVQGQSHARFARAIFPNSSIEICTRQNLVERCAVSDLTFLCTSSLSSVFPSGYKFKKGSSVISVGSFAPNRCEVDSSVIEANTPYNIVVDDVETCLKQCGAVMSLMSSKTNKNDHQGIFSLGELLLNQEQKNQSSSSPMIDPEGVNFYFSVGLGIQDAIVCDFLLEE